MKKGFTLLETLIVIAILVVLMAASVFFFREWIKNRKIEGDTAKIYQLVKNYQLLAAREKKVVLIGMENSTTIKVEVDGKTYFYSLETPFELNASGRSTSLKINQLGIFTVMGNFHSLENATGIKNCVKVDNLRACEGHYDVNTGQCICEF